MFNLTTIEDVIRIEPSQFGIPTEKVLQQEINRKYANRVLHNIGLCICIYDIESHGDGLIKPGDGAVYVQTKFRIIVFRPFVGEILVGWVSSCTSDGLNVRMEFFDDIYIPRSMLFETCEFVAAEQAWIWKTPSHDFYIDTNEKIRFRVEQEHFVEQHPKGPKDIENDSANQIAPYTIVGSCQIDGMGLVSWWE
jgi:DNA-directed RNA polymerase III subunit RPC8